MGIFSGRHFPRDIILWAVRWYCRYGVSYRDLEEMMTERGVPVDHTTIYRWVQKYAPELDKHTRWYRQVPDWQARSWRVDETYIRVGGTWCYLYRAITAGGQTLDFYLSEAQCRGGQAFPGQDAAIEYDSRVPAGHQHRQGTSSGQGNIRAEGGGNLPSDGGAPAGEIPEQRYRGRSWPT